MAVVEEAPGKQDLVWPAVGEQPPFWTRLPAGGPVAAALTTGTGGSITPAAHQDGEKIHVVHITAEMAPLAKVGGLGDVVTGTKSLPLVVPASKKLRLIVLLAP